jgi:hypothetical protein
MGGDTWRNILDGYRLIADDISDLELSGNVDSLRDLITVGQSQECDGGIVDGLGHGVHLRGSDAG